jgi:hypothetical protein
MSGRVFSEERTHGQVFDKNRRGWFQEIQFKLVRKTRNSFSKTRYRSQSPSKSTLSYIIIFFKPPN